MSAIEGIGPEITPSSRGRFSRFILRALGSAGLVFSPLIIACSPDAKAGAQPFPSQPDARPTATAVGIGSVFIPTGNEEIDNIQKRLMDPTTKGQVPEEDILKFNEAIGKRAEGTATAEAQKSITPEVKVQSYECSIFPKDFCPQVELVDFLNPKGKQVFVAGINLPEGVDRVPVFTPIPGGLRNAINNPGYAEVGELVNDPTFTNIAYEGSFEFVQDSKVQPGDLVGYLVKGNTKRKIGTREYDATITASVKNPITGQFESGNEQMKRYFSQAKVVSEKYTADTSSSGMNYTVTFEKTAPSISR